MIELTKFQKRAVGNLKLKVINVLRNVESGVVVFQAPTGSGKTVMVSEMIKELVKHSKDSRKYSFIWISVRMLHEQSKEKLEKYYEDDELIKCSYFEDLEDKRIGENEILFINWHSINKKDINIYVKENDYDNNLNSIIQNTKNDEREIILIIDESHHTAKSERSKELIEVIEPKVAIEVSATPHLKENISEIEKVYLAEVKADEMIKSEIAVNPEFLNINIGPRDTDTLVIEQALKKRDELKEFYKKEGVNINPLVLIQLPDKRSDLQNKKDDVMKILQDKFNVTEENGKLAVWLSEEKTDTLVNIDKNDNEVEVLIFKQAIALGWDCPRASILVIFRESKSFTFTIQTIGRIMRMPERRYYTSDDLNKGFVFTNLPNIEITEEYAKDYLTTHESKRNNNLYNCIKLLSIYLKRQRERTRLSGEFVMIFKELADKLNLHEKIVLEPEKTSIPIIADGTIVDVDKRGIIEHKGQLEIMLNEEEIQKIFNKFIADNCSPYAPADSSDRMKTALYQFLAQKLSLKKFDPQVQKIVIARENRQIFVDTISEAKEKYSKKVKDKLSDTREEITNPSWEVPLIDSYKSGAKKGDVSRSIMQPFFAVKQSEPEKTFITSLDSSDKVVWWYKNREGENKYFAVKYKDENGKDAAFYIDFIVQFKNGSIGLFDTKSGITAKEAKFKAEALQKYIGGQVSRGKRIWGGIVVPKKGSIFLNDSDEYKYDPSSLADWKVLEL